MLLPAAFHDCTAVTRLAVLLAMLSLLPGHAIAQGMLKQCDGLDRHGWISSGVFCYGFFPTSAAFGAALDQCRSKGSQLISIHSQDETQFLRYSISFLRNQSQLYMNTHTYWIGLQQAQDGKYKWADGTQLNYENWERDEPNNENETCVELYHWGTWNDNRCNEKNGYICRSPNEADAIQGCSILGRLDWISSGNFCYYVTEGSSFDRLDHYCQRNFDRFNPLVRLNFGAAERQCQTMSSQLASIHSDSEWRFIVKAIEFYRTRCLKGISVDSYWIGLKNEDGINKWLDGTPVDYQKWHPNYSTGGNCVLMDTSRLNYSGYFHYGDCTWPKGYICKAKETHARSGQRNIEPTHSRSSTDNEGVFYMAAVIALLVLSWVVFGVVQLCRRRGRPTASTPSKDHEDMHSQTGFHKHQELPHSRTGTSVTNVSAPSYDTLDVCDDDHQYEVCRTDKV